MTTAGSPAGTPGTAVAAPGVLCVHLGAGVRAGFTLRDGPGPHGSNLGLGVGEDRAPVLARRRALAGWAGTPLAWATQVHGSGVLVGPAAADDGSPVAEADAIVVGRGAGAAVVVADCVPVLLADADAGVGAAVHAGRRGLVDGVVQAAVAAMVTAGARPDRIRAAVGPAICGRCYEVPAAMRDEVADVVPAVASRTSWDTPALDLPAGVVAVLAAVGVGTGAGASAVHRTGWCTATDDRFHSHRRSTRTGEPSGRCAAVVAIAGATGRVGPGW